MKINSDFEPQAGQGVSGAGTASGAGSVQSHKNLSHSNQTGSADKADLSSDAQQFAILSAQSSHVPDVRADRVATLKSAIQNGSYSVSNHQIAQSMLRDFDPGS